MPSIKETLRASPSKKMRPPPSPDPVHISPKRKREAAKTCTETSCPATRLKTINDETGSALEGRMVRSNSPRSSVARRMQSLDLQEINYIPAAIGWGEAAAQQHQGRVGQDHAFEPDVYLPERYLGEPLTPPSPSSHRRSSPCGGAIDPAAAEVVHSADPLIEVPETPRRLSSATTTLSSSSSLTSPHPPSSAKSSRATVSPTTFSSSPGGLWWSETEITGHNSDPSDPMDDGEGINGIGFIPTPA
ncbi:MAG: hypothetical protein Q9163_002860, partial [Psora crenata]